MDRRHITGYVAALSLLAAAGVGAELARSPYGQEPAANSAAPAADVGPPPDLTAQVKRIETLLARVQSRSNQTVAPPAVQVVQRAAITQTQSS